MAERVIVVTGSASGIGRATAARLRAGGERVIGVDLKDADILADLSTRQGREAMAAAVKQIAPGIDGIVANAGVLGPDRLCYAVNYFGAIGTIETLKPLLSGSESPRVAITASMASGMPMAGLDALVEQLERGETPPDTDMNGAGYSASKVGICRWMRRIAVQADWAGRGIPINAVAPGVVESPMGDIAMQQPEVQAVLVATPMGRRVTSEEIAEVLAFLVSPANRFMTGQTIFVDGGLNALLRPDHV